MDLVTKEKWDNAAAAFDLMSAGPEKRWAPRKRELFSKMHGKVLFFAVGTGLDIQFFPSDQDITGIDISTKMLEKAQPRAAQYQGELELLEMDVHELTFAENTFDQVFTSCTFCSVPNPIRGLEALKRVLRPGGQLCMFEHTGSHYFPFNILLNMMTSLSRRFGPEMNRETVQNVERAGFSVTRVTNIFLDVVKMIEAEAPSSEAAV